MPLGWTVVLRKQCEEPSTEIACSGPNGVVERELEPGEYVVLTGGQAHLQPADLTLRVARPAEWDAPVPPSVSPDPVPQPLELADPEKTPRTEPEPGTTIDRLVMVALEPGQTGRLRIDLEGACFGRAADLAVRGGVVRLDDARTCVTKEGELAKVAVEAPRADLADRSAKVTAQGAFGRGDVCEGTWPRGGVACVPAGAYVFGGPEFRAFADASTWPPRVARMTRFFIDVEEISVARWRAALGRGFVSPDPLAPWPNDGPFGTSVGAVDGDETAKKLCTWTSTPGPRETLPVTCLSWYAAKAFCAFVGGDLPTEAQWEYVASAAGRAQKVAYVWGDPAARPRCDQAAWGRSSQIVLGGGGCYSPDVFSPNPTATPGTEDITPNGVVGLAGNANEWLLDSAQPLSAACWRRAPLTDPACVESNALMRSVRGGSWLGIPDALRSTFRTRQDPGHIVDGVAGARCVYREPPR
ncbi:MAG: formylglycine-generating enzyme family protein [Deltaproteobacteria bacterium]|nr:formylglycine-generating enzyme family protein [Deltaproteobacteria bacterium]